LRTLTYAQLQLWWSQQQIDLAENTKTWGDWPSLAEAMGDLEGIWAQSDRPYADPIYWAGFQILGNLSNLSQNPSNP
jgi:CHAT domain-containing protein